MELKVQCPCGQKYKFDVEPVGGCMPFTVQCPICHVDGTEMANELLRGLPLVSHSAIPVATVAPAPPAVPVARLSVSHAPPGPALSADSVRPASPAGAIGKGGRREEPRYALGILGALIGGFIGMMGWFLLIKWTHYEIGIAAWGVGGLAGVGARIFGSRGGPMLGTVAAVTALIAILGGQYLAVRGLTEEFLAGISSVAFQTQLGFAREISEAKTEEEKRAVLAKHRGTRDQAYNVTDAEWAKFKGKQLPEMEAMASGKVTEKDFANRLSGARQSFAYHYEIMKASVGLLTLLWLFLGVGTAWRLGSGESDRADG